MHAMSHIGMVSKMSNTHYGRMLLGIIDGLEEEVEELAKFQEWLKHKHKDLYSKLLDEFEKEKGENND